jgi:hypothetical protein
MVKNTIGGKKGKMLANKRSGSGGNKKLRLSVNEDEVYVCVSKVFGGGIFEVMDNDGVIFKAHLRGKMKGPNKRHNFVSLFSILLIGKRSDLSDSLNCDILFVYDDHDILSLSVLPNLKIFNILSFHQNHSMVDGKQNDHLFSNVEDTDTIIIPQNHCICEQSDSESQTDINFDLI